MIVFKIENEKIYQGCGNVKAAIDSNGKVVDLLYHPGGYVDNNGKVLDLDEAPATSRTKINYYKEKEIFMKKNKGYQIVRGMASCYELVVFG